MASLIFKCIDGCDKRYPTAGELRNHLLKDNHERVVDISSFTSLITWFECIDGVISSFTSLITWFECIDGCDKRYRTVGELRNHLENDHQEPVVDTSSYNFYSGVVVSGS